MKSVMITLTPTAVDVNLISLEQTVRQRLTTVMAMRVRMMEPVNDGINSFSCDCADGFTGDRCETDVDECYGDPCQNGGTCLDGVNNYTCNCAVGFTGDRCETDVDECDRVICENNGTCLDGINNYTCNCTCSFGGRNCQTHLNNGK